jgi:hypothetical protein
MLKQGLVSGLDVRHVLNEDCTECDQAKFKKQEGHIQES